jgi:hypothetical protein
VKVCTKALAGGWTDVELTAALDDVHVISGAALDRWRRARDNGRGRGTRVDDLTTEAIAARAAKRYGSRR